MTLRLALHAPLRLAFGLDLSEAVVHDHGQSARLIKYIFDRRCNRDVDKPSLKPLEIRLLENPRPGSFRYGHAANGQHCEDRFRKALRLAFHPALRLAL